MLMKLTAKRSPYFVIVVLLTFLLVVLGCGLVPKPSATPTPTIVPTPKPIPTPAPGSTAITITEADANAALQKAIGMQDNVQIENARIDFRPDGIFTSATTQIGALSIQLGILASATPVDGKVKIDILDVQVNGKEASGIILDQIKAMIDPILEQLTIVEDKFYVESITITNDKMVIIGHQQ